MDFGSLISSKKGSRLAKLKLPVQMSGNMKPAMQRFSLEISLLELYHRLLINQMCTLFNVMLSEILSKLRQGEMKVIKSYHSQMLKFLEPFTTSLEIKYPIRVADFKLFRKLENTVKIEAKINLKGVIDKRKMQVN